ncbi:MAG: restriction endonuclease subunit M, partial [Tepidisphaerales bacterium]
LSWYFRSINSVARRDDFPKIIIQQTRELPLHSVNLSKKADKSSHDRLVSLVEQMLSLHKSLAAAQSPHDKEPLQRQIDATDRQIDRLVYDLYGLTEKEIQVVEESTQTT